MNNLAFKLLKLAAIIFALGIIFRIFQFHDHNLVPVINMAPSAFHRIADTVLLFSIAASLVALSKGKSGGEE